MIGGSQGVPRRELREPMNANSSTISSSTTTASAAPGGDNRHLHPHVSGRPLPYYSSGGGDSSSNSNTNNLVQELTQLSQRQLIFSPAIGGTGYHHNQTRGNEENNNNNSTTMPLRRSTSSNVTNNNNHNNNATPMMIDTTTQRELDLLWKALEEERHVVKMKNEVISSLEKSLKTERAARIQVEAERDGLRDTIATLRSQIQLSRSYQLTDDASPPHGSPPSTHGGAGRPNPIPIGFTSSSSHMKRQQQQNQNQKQQESFLSAQKRRAAMIMGSQEFKPTNADDEDELSPGMRAALANEYLETELNQTLDHMERYQIYSLSVVCDLEKMERDCIVQSYESEVISTLATFMRREQCQIILSQESTARRQELVNWCQGTIDLSVAFSQDREESAVKYFKQTYNRIEKELFINMQDLARADDRTSKHHEELSKYISSFFNENLINLHYQCAFELFRGESSILRWQGAINHSHIGVPRWFGDVQETFNKTVNEMSEFFAASTKLLLLQQQEMMMIHQRNRIATNSWMSSNNTTMRNNNNQFGGINITPTGTPRAGGGGGFSFHHHHNNNNNGSRAPTPERNQHYHHDPNINNNNSFNSSGMDEGELFERIRHLEGRLAQKTRLIGLHVKRIQELEMELSENNNVNNYHHYQQQQQIPQQRQNMNNNLGTPPPSSTSHDQQHLAPPIIRFNNNNNNNNNPVDNAPAFSSAQQLLSLASTANNNNNNNINRTSSGRSNSQLFNNSAHSRSSTVAPNNNSFAFQQQQQFQQFQQQSQSSSSLDQQQQQQQMYFASLPQNQIFNLFEDWRAGLTSIVTEMHEDLMMIVRPWARVPRALLAQMQDAAAASHRRFARLHAEDSESNLQDSTQHVFTTNPHLQPDAGGGQSPPKQPKTMFIRGLGRNDVKEHIEYETQAMAATLIMSPETVFENAVNANDVHRAGASGGKSHNKAIWNHFFNYVSTTLLDEARAFSINLLRQHDDLVSAFHVLRPVIRSVDVVRLSLMEGALSLAEAQRDQALTSSHWIHTQAEHAVETLRGLVTKTEQVTQEQKQQSAEEAANQARALAAARRLEELGQGGHGPGGPSSNQTMQEVMTAFDNVNAQHAALNDPEQAENQRLAEEFATKCNLLVNRASFLYKRLIERERDVDILSRALAEVETKEAETRDSTDASIVAQVLEREIADEALFMLREAILEERQYAQETIRALLSEVQERNYAIRDLQRMLKDSLLSCRFAQGLAEHAQFSMVAMHECYLEMGKKLLRTQRAQLLPPISEVSLQMFIAHFEYGDSLLQSHSHFLDQVHDAQDNVDALVQRRKLYEKEMLEMGQELFRLNQENRVAKGSVKNLEQWAFSFVTDSVTMVQGINGAAFNELTRELFKAYEKIEEMRKILPKNYVDVSERLEIERFERAAFEERTRLLEQKLTKITTEVLESQHDLSETRGVCEKLDRLRIELEDNNKELELLLLQEREAAEQLRDRNISITDELHEVRAELANVKRALIAESEAHSATIRNFSRR